MKLGMGFPTTKILHPHFIPSPSFMSRKREKLILHFQMNNSAAKLFQSTTSCGNIFHLNV